MLRRLFFAVAVAVALAGTAAAQIIPAAPPSHLTASPAAPCTSCSPEKQAAPEGFFEVDYLWWWVKKGPLSYPLVTSGSIADPVPGALGQPGTRTLFDAPLGYGDFSGLRFTAAVPLAEGIALEGSFFFLEQRSTGATFGPNVPAGSALTRPIFNPDTGANEAVGVSVPVPGVNYSGTTNVYSSSRLSGYTIDATAKLYETDTTRVWGLAGYRHLDLNERLTVNDRLTAIDAGVLNVGPDLVPPGGSLTAFDAFRAKNAFDGVDLGLRGEWRYGKWDMVGTYRVAFGNTRQTVNVNGGSTIVGAAAGLPGGVLALPGNSGDVTRNKFGYAPESRFSIGYALTENIRVNVGYTYLYWSDVVRPGAQVDGGVNPNRVPSLPSFGTPGGSDRPALRVRDGEFWAHGVNAGLMIKF